MNRALLSKRISSLLAEVSRLSNALCAMNTIDLQRYPENYELLSTDAALRAEQIACRMRHLVYGFTTVQKHEYLTSAANVLGITITAQPGLVEITLPGLLPKKKQRSAEYLTDPLEQALGQFVKDHPLSHFESCIICFCHIYAVSGGRGRIRDYDNLEMKQILDVVCAYHHWTPIFVTLLGTGMRIAECVGLTRKDIDFENELISVNHNLLYRKIDGKCRFLISTPKTASSIRFIPMCPEVLAELAGLVAILDTLYDTPSPTIDGYTDFIFRNRYGDLLNPHSLNRAIERIVRDYNAEESGLAEEDQRPPLLLPHFSVHSLRHTFCTRMFEVESNHKAIQTIMGHAEISTTLDIYAHITEDTLKNSVQHMSEKIKLFG